ncbi:universal stress protein [Georgenia sp. 10Sc9-8]|uniref:Universal stress protein n=1 Tax=Georgenia halotolerans TaxID=3028317 RepID=A0ABT5U3W1_9MICO|nr:universal stress protein [Georgenia halotolerans]
MKILVGYTTSPEGRAALRRAVAEAKLRDGELVVLHYERVAPPVGDVTERYRAVEDALQEIKRDLAARDVRVSIRSSIGVSSAGSETIRVAEEEDVDLIVLGLRRRSAVGKLVLGSAAQEILLSASCPVLAVKHDDTP